MPTKLITVAGPQSSGKTTILNLLKTRFPTYKFISEINPYTIVGNHHFGAAFTNKETELKIVDKDIKTIENIDLTEKIVIIETGILHLSYLELLCSRLIADNYYLKYLSAHRGLNSIIFFIDTKPKISWLRRKNNYLKRLDKVGIRDQKKRKIYLNKYKTRIYELYPLWLKYYHRVPFQKIMIKNSYKDYQKFISGTLSTISHFVR
jgi:hypothetical protein